MIKHVTFCGGGEMRIVAPECPNASEHTPSPTGYVAEADWADEMLKTHRQVKCSGCGLYAIWVPK